MVAVKDGKCSVLAVGRAASHDSAGSSGRRWLPAGSGICISPRVVVSCVHVVGDVYIDPRQKKITLKSPLNEKDMAVLDLGLRWRVPTAVIPDLELDLAILRFDRPLSLPPATVGINFTADIARALSRDDDWGAVGFPGHAGGRTVTDAQLVNGIGVAESNREDDCASRLVFNGGIAPGFSGGALVWLGHSEQPVVGMPRLGGESTVTVAYAMDLILRVLRDNRLWPSRPFCMADLISPLQPTAADDLDRRRQRLQPAFESLRATMYAQGLSVSVIPQGRVRSADGTLHEVPRPVAMMCAPVSVEFLDGTVEAQLGLKHRMAHNLSRHQAELIAEQLPTPSGGCWRLPTLAEWWMGVTAGRRQQPSSSANPPPAPLLVQEAAENCWQIRYQPDGSFEWLAGEAGIEDGAISSRGHLRKLNPAARAPNIGFRLVWDPVERAT
jgi:Trypsin-like peptidase domain